MRSTTCGFQNLGNLTGEQRLTYVGPTLEVDIGFDPSYHHTNSAPPLAGAKVDALIDTGAGQSCIDATLAMQLQLPIVNQAPVAGVHGSQVLNVHLGQVYVPALKQVLYGNFIGADLAGGGQAHRALIGRDFLRHFRMIYDGRSGHVTLEIDP